MARVIWGALASAALALGVVSCGDEAVAPVDSSPDAPEGISVANGRLNLPAVAGNPGAVYFTISNSSGENQMIRSVHVRGGESAVLHQSATQSGQMEMLLQIDVPAGEDVVFEPGVMHVMVMNLDETLEVGGETEVTLSFVRGDKVSFPVTIRSPGDDS